MPVNRRLSRSQKRAWKKREDRRKKFGQLVRPYEGRKYQGESYVNVVMYAEAGIREADDITGNAITDRHVLNSLEYLVLELQERRPDSPPPGNPTTDSSQGQSKDLIASRIQAKWEELFATEPRPATTDLTGVLRTIMNSVQTRGSMYGQDRGYLDFLIEFLGRISQPKRRQRLTIDDVLPHVLSLDELEEGDVLILRPNE